MPNTPTGLVVTPAKEMLERVMEVMSSDDLATMSALITSTATNRTGPGKPLAAAVEEVIEEVARNLVARMVDTAIDAAQAAYAVPTRVAPNT